MISKNSSIDILFVTHRYQIAGGAEKALIDLLEYLSRKDMRIHVVVGGKGSFVKELKRLKITYSIVFQPYWAHSENDPSPFHFTSLNPTVNTTLQLVELIQTLRPKLCVTNTIVIPWLAYASSLTRTPHAWMIHELGTAGLDLRYAIGEHQTLTNIDNLSDIIFFNSKYTSEYYLPYLSSRVEKSIVYPGGNTPKPTDIDSPYKKNVFKLIAVAQIKPQKGQMDAVKAVKNLHSIGQKVQLVLVGMEEDKEYVKKIREYISEHRLNDSIMFAGLQDNPASFVEHADVALVTSRNDAFGRVTVEAMLQNKPVIAAASAGSLEIIENEKTGLFYEPGDDKDLAEKILTIIKHPSEAKLMANNAHKTATEKYNEDARYANLIEYLNRPVLQKTAIDLTPLNSVLIDFRATIDLLKHSQAHLKNLESSRWWKVRQKIRAVIKHN